MLHDLIFILKIYSREVSIQTTCLKTHGGGLREFAIKGVGRKWMIPLVFLESGI